MKEQDFQYRFGLGVIVAVFFLVPVLATFSPNSIPELEAYKPWQESMAAVLGLIAAAFAANYVVMQIRHAQALEDTRLARSRRAWRATMPQAMSTIADYATRSYDALVDQHAIANKPGGLLAANNPVKSAPEPDIAVLADIRAMIEVSAPHETDHFVEVLNDLQVHRARWSGRQRRLERNDQLTAVELEDEMVEAAELYARASNLIGATRLNEPNDAPTTRHRALRLLTPNMDPIPRVAAAAVGADARRPLSLPVPPAAPPPSRTKLLTQRFRAGLAHLLQKRPMAPHDRDGAETP